MTRKLGTQVSSGQGLICPDCWYKPFEITSVCRADLVRFFSMKEIAKLDDTDMSYIAGEMADAYCESVFWDSLKTIVEEVLDNRQ